MVSALDRAIESIPAKVTDDLSPYVPWPGTSLLTPSKGVKHNETQSLCFCDTVFAWFSAYFPGSSESLSFVLQMPTFFWLSSQLPYISPDYFIYYHGINYLLHSDDLKI